MNELKDHLNKCLFMKKVMYILLLALLAGHVQARFTIDADDPNIQYTGRINHADPKAPRMW